MIAPTGGYIFTLLPFKGLTRNDPAIVAGFSFGPRKTCFAITHPDAEGYIWGIQFRPYLAAAVISATKLSWIFLT